MKLTQQSLSTYVNLALLVSLILFSCSKEPGEGGRASITGKVYVMEYDKNCTVIKDEYYGVDEAVYIIAGNDPSYFQRIRTGPDGTFWFPNLRIGKYKVYSLSNNCAVPGKTEPIILEVEITKKSQKFVTEDIKVIR
jgi:hypothetical protein